MTAHGRPKQGKKTGHIARHISVSTHPFVTPHPTTHLVLVALRHVLDHSRQNPRPISLPIVSNRHLFPVFCWSVIYDHKQDQSKARGKTSYNLRLIHLKREFIDQSTEKELTYLDAFEPTCSGGRGVSGACVDAKTKSRHRTAHFRDPGREGKGKKQVQKKTKKKNVDHRSLLHCQFAISAMQDRA